MQTDRRTHNTKFRTLDLKPRLNYVGLRWNVTFLQPWLKWQQPLNCLASEADGWNRAFYIQCLQVLRHAKNTLFNYFGLQWNATLLQTTMKYVNDIMNSIVWHWKHMGEAEIFIFKVCTFFFMQKGILHRSRPLYYQRVKEQ